MGGGSWFPLGVGVLGSSLEREPGFAIAVLSDAPRYGLGPVLLQPVPHEFVTKASFAQDVRCDFGVRSIRHYTTTLRRFAARVIPV